MFTCEYSAISNPEYIYISRILSKTEFREVAGKSAIKLKTPSGDMYDPITIFLTLSQVHFQRTLSPQEVTWVEWTYQSVFPQELDNPHHTSSALFEFFHSQLGGSMFLSGLVAPGPVDLLLGAVLAGRMRAVTPLFMSKYFRVVRWFNSINSAFHILPSAIDINTQPKPVKPAPVKAAAGTQKEEKVIAPKAIASNAFYRAEIRVGKIVGVEKHPNADRLFVEKVDIGREEPITVVSGLVGNVALEELQDRLALFVVNLKPAVMFKVKSQGMILVSKHSEGESTTLEPVQVPEGAKLGERLLLEGYEEEGADTQLNPKEAPWTEVISALECREGTVYYQKDKRPLVNGQPITSTKVPNGIIS